MSFFRKIADFFTSTRRPEPGTPVQSAQQVSEALLSVNRDSAPFVVRKSNKKNADLLAEWKIVDAKWYEIFAKASLKRVFKIHLKIDDTKKEVRALDEEFAVSWRAGVPTLEVAAEYFRGQKQEVSMGGAYAFTEELKPGVVYNYRFNTKELKGPLQEAVTKAGWTYRGVTSL